MPYNPKIVGKFERSQLPVGHGGFHIGTLNVEGELFRYFFDCGGGADGKKLINAEFERNSFDFGVISHFDADHFSQLSKASVKRVFIPYLEELDMFFLTLTHFAKSGKFFNFSDALTQLASKVELVMVQHVPSNNNYRDDLFGPAQDENEISMKGIKAVKQGAVYSISDNEDIFIGTKTNDLVTLKFYNHRAEEIRTSFNIALNDALTKSAPANAPSTKTTARSGKATKVPAPSPALSDALNKSYATVEDFLADVKKDPANIIQKNAARLKAAYAEILNGHGESGVTSSNLSSLTMFSVTTDSTKRRFCRKNFFTKPPSAVGCDHHHNYDYECDGWMLTGDLELTGKIWGEFYKHYNLAIEQCAVFNVPHHGSAKAFDDSAIHHITTKKHFIFPVKENDKSHPAPALITLLEDYGIEDNGTTKVTEKPNSQFTLTRLYCGEI